MREGADTLLLLLDVWVERVLSKTKTSADAECVYRDFSTNQLFTAKEKMSLRLLAADSQTGTCIIKPILLLTDAQEHLSCEI